MSLTADMRLYQPVGPAAAGLAWFFSAYFRFVRPYSGSGDCTLKMYTDPETLWIYNYGRTRIQDGQISGSGIVTSALEMFGAEVSCDGEPETDVWFGNIIFDTFEQTGKSSLA